MPWHEAGSDWTGKTAAELRPVIVSLCNAVGDRYQCIGLNRPGWTVNLDQDSVSLSLGTKSDPLEEADLYGLDIFRYGWWGQIAGYISGLLARGGTGLPGGGSLCGGWSKTATGDGYGSDLWTLADLETEIGMGEIGASSVGGSGSTMHLFDEVAPNRLREFLDRMIYPVIFPYDRGGDWTNLDAEGYDTTALSAAEDASNFRGYATPDPGDGNDAWASATSFSYINNYPLASVFAFPGPEARADKQLLRYCVFDFTTSENGAGCLGEITKQVFVVLVQGGADGVDYTFLGKTLSLTGPYSNEMFYITDADTLSTVSDRQAFSVQFQNWANDPDSPFSGSGSSGGIDYVGLGSIYAIPRSMFAVITDRKTPMAGDRENATRIILDISGYCADQ